MSLRPDSCNVDFANGLICSFDYSRPIVLGTTRLSSDGRDVDLPMADGSGRVDMAPHALYIIDPHSRVLRDEPRFEAWQDWNKEQAAAKAKAKQ